MLNVHSVLTTISLFAAFIRQLIATIIYWPYYALHNKDAFEDSLSIGTCCKNDGAYLKEFIEYHKLIGVSRFYIVDNESTDNTKEVLEPYIKSGDVIYLYRKNKKNLSYLVFKFYNSLINKKQTGTWTSYFQPNYYSEIIRLCKSRTKWLALIDSDEFIVPRLGLSSVVECLNEYEKNMQEQGREFCGIVINWVNYGHGGHKIKPQGLITENFRYCDGGNGRIKNIVNPRLVAKANVHIHYLLLGKHSIDGDYNGQKKVFHISSIEFSPKLIKNLRINHYSTKSYEESLSKIHRNFKSDVGGFYKENTAIPFECQDAETWKKIAFSSIPNIYDYVMENYVEKLKKIMNG